MQLNWLFKSLCRTTPKKTSMFGYPLQKHSFHSKSEADRLFVQQIFPVNENEIQTVAGIGLSLLTKDPRCKNVTGCNSTNCLRACAGQHKRKHQWSILITVPLIARHYLVSPPKTQLSLKIWSNLAVCSTDFPVNNKERRWDFSSLT